MNTFRSPRRRAGFLAGVTAVLIAASGCGGDDSDTASTSGDSAAEPPADAIVSTMDIENFGTVLVDAEGNTLYTTEAEDDGTIKCVDGCAEFWPPMAADDSVPPSIEGIDGEFSVVRRPDGTDQVTLDGKPLYTFADDTGPGSFVGDGFEDDFQGTHFVWHAVTVDGSAPAEEDDAPPAYDY